MQESLQPGEDGADVADSGEDDVCSVALTAFKVAAAEVTVGPHVADHGLQYDCHAKRRVRHRPPRRGRAMDTAGGAPTGRATAQVGRAPRIGRPPVAGCYVDLNQYCLLSKCIGVVPTSRKIQCAL